MSVGLNSVGQPLDYNTQAQCLLHQQRKQSSATWDRAKDASAAASSSGGRSAGGGSSPLWPLVHLLIVSLACGRSAGGGDGGGERRQLIGPELRCHRALWLRPAAAPCQPAFLLSSSWAARSCRSPRLSPPEAGLPRLGCPGGAPWALIAPWLAQERWEERGARAALLKSVLRPNNLTRGAQAGKPPPPPNRPHPRQARRGFGRRGSAAAAPQQPRFIIPLAGSAPGAAMSHPHGKAAKR